MSKQWIKLNQKPHTKTQTNKKDAREQQQKPKRQPQEHHEAHFLRILRIFLNSRWNDIAENNKQSNFLRPFSTRRPIFVHYLAKFFFLKAISSNLSWVLALLLRQKAHKNDILQGSSATSSHIYAVFR